MKQFTINRCGHLFQVVKAGICTVFQTHNEDEAYRFVRLHFNDDYTTRAFKFLSVPDIKYGEVMRTRTSSI